MMLMQGLGSMGSGLGQGLAAMGQQMERQREERKRESDEFKALQSLAKAAYGLEPDQTTAMGLPDLRGLVRGKEIERIEAERKQRGDYTALQMEQLRESLAQQRNRAAVQQGNARALPEILKRSQGQQAPAPMRDPGMAFQQRPMDLRGLAGIAQAEGYQMESPADLQALGEVVLPKERPVLPPNFVPKSAKIGGIEYGLPEEPDAWNLKPGQEVAVGKDRRAVATSKNSIQILNDEVAAEVPNDPALYAEDDAEFATFVRKLPTEKQRKWAVDFRQSYKNLTKEAETDPLKAMMVDLVAERMGLPLPSRNKGAKPKPGAPAGGGAQFKFDPSTGGIVPVK